MWIVFIGVCWNNILLLKIITLSSFFFFLIWLFDVHFYFIKSKTFHYYRADFRYNFLLVVSLVVIEIVGKYFHLIILEILGKLSNFISKLKQKNIFTKLSYELKKVELFVLLFHQKLFYFHTTEVWNMNEHANLNTHLNLTYLKVKKMLTNK